MTPVKVPLALRKKSPPELPLFISMMLTCTPAGVRVSFSTNCPEWIVPLTVKVLVAMNSSLAIGEIPVAAQVADVPTSGPAITVHVPE